MKKIGILTIHNAINYGAVLQAYALEFTLEKIGYEVEIINYIGTYNNDTNYKKRNLKKRLKKIFWHNKYRLHDYKCKKFDNFMQNYYQLSSKKYNKTSIKKIESQYDYFVTGSDQIWNLEITQQDTTFMLDFVSDSSKKISYAASFGYEKIPEKYVEITGKYLGLYASLLVREKSGVALLKNAYNLLAKFVLDPTLLLDEYGWKQLISDRLIKDKYIVIYTVACQKNLIEVAKKYAKENDCQIYFIRLEPQKEKDLSIHPIYDAGPKEFLSYIKYADCVFTTSFHGFAFAVNFNVNVYYEADKELNNNTGRLIDLAYELGLSYRCISQDYFTDDNKKIIDWNVVNQKLNRLRLASVNELNKALGGK